MKLSVIIWVVYKSQIFNFSGGILFVPMEIIEKYFFKKNKISGNKILYSDKNKISNYKK